jgi:hypothetical protein
MDSNFMEHDLSLDENTRSVYHDPIDGFLAEDADRVPNLPPPVNRGRFDDVYQKRKRVSATSSRSDNPSRPSKAPIHTSGETRRMTVAPPRHSSFGMKEQIDQLRRRETIDSRSRTIRRPKEPIIRLKVMVMPKKSKNKDNDKVVMLRMDVSIRIDIRSVKQRIKNKCTSAGED